VTLKLLQKGLGNREAAVLRELTKLYEESRRGLLSELIEYYARAGEPKGEVVIVIAPPGEEQISDDALSAKLKLLLKTHAVKDAASILAEETGRARKEIYTLALTLIGKQDG
jgi:16S rRNA (cytidine1402-2'-O)-methyltransferase